MPANSLLKYEEPELVSSGAKLPESSASKTSPSQTDNILNSIFPSREWAEGNKIWVQKVSSVPSSRTEVTELAEELNSLLEQKQARLTGICPIRRELYSQCFDELMRQVTINSGERGLLVLKVRDEIKMTIATYQKIYKTSLEFGMRKALESEYERNKMLSKIAELEDEKEDLKKQLNEQKAKHDVIEIKQTERKQVEEKKHSEEITALQRASQQLKSQLDGILTIKRAKRHFTSISRE